MIRCRLLLALILGVVTPMSKRPIDRAEIYSLREATREMLNHAYNGYETRAYPRDELMPVTCQGKDTWGGYKVTDLIFLPITRLMFLVFITCVYDK